MNLSSKATELTTTRAGKLQSRSAPATMRPWMSGRTWWVHLCSWGSLLVWRSRSFLIDSKLDMIWWTTTQINKICLPTSTCRLISLNQNSSSPTILPLRKCLSKLRELLTSACTNYWKVLNQHGSIIILELRRHSMFGAPPWTKYLIGSSTLWVS